MFTRRRLLQSSLLLTCAPAILSAQTPALDVIVIGAGLAGLTSARELSLKGYSTVILEARDRIGGRTHSTEFAGRSVELGGTWVHSTQPYIWAEIERYGLALEAMPSGGGQLAVMSQGQLLKPAGAVMRQALAALDEFCVSAARYVPDPYKPLTVDNPLENISISEHLQTLTADQSTKDALEGILATLFNGPLDQIAASEVLRLYALGGYTPSGLLASVSGTKFRDGTIALMNNMRDHGRAELRLQQIVTAISDEGNSVAVGLSDGSELRAKVVIVTVPLNVLTDVKFSPALSSSKQQAIREPHGGSGTKIFARVNGDTGGQSVLAPQSEPLDWVVTQYHDSASSVLILFGSNPATLDANDLGAVQQQLDRVMPGFPIQELYNWDWNGDPYAKGTWCSFQPGRTRRDLSLLADATGRVFFASADWAYGWRGFMDGAIESGLRAARETAIILR